MKKVLLLIFVLVVIAGLLIISTYDNNPQSENTDKTIKIVAAENFYGSVAEQIGGKYVDVQSIINNPDADPHLFSTSSSIGIAISKAQIIIFNGAGYDQWMNGLINAQSNNNKLGIINVSQLMDIKEKTDNPHIWYKPETFPTVAKKITELLSSITHDPQATAYFQANLKAFQKEHQQVTDLIDSIKSKYSGTPVTATEPVFGYMADALGLDMKGVDFQWEIMNDVEPTPAMLSHYNARLNKHSVAVLFYNDQVTTPMINNILQTAKDNHISIVGVSETMPKADNVNHWFMQELKETQQALKSAKQ